MPDARATRDVDLACSAAHLENAVREVERLASVDLGDHFRFVSRGHPVSLGGANQPSVTGKRMVFDVYIGTQRKNPVNLDLVVGLPPTSPPELRAPLNRLNLPRLTGFDYLLYPVVDQIADKVCATRERHGALGAPSSRVKDLVDLAFLAIHQPVCAASLRLALITETARRRMQRAGHFEIPPGWSSKYITVAGPIALLDPYPSADDAAALVSDLLDPVLSGRVWTGQWNPLNRSWDEGQPGLSREVSAKRGRDGGPR